MQENIASSCFVKPSKMGDFRGIDKKQIGKQKILIFLFAGVHPSIGNYRLYMGVKKTFTNIFKTFIII